MSRVAVGLVVAGSLIVAAGVAVSILVLLVAKRAAPRVKARVIKMPHRFQEAMPQGFGPRRMMGDLEAMTEELRRIRELLEEERRRAGTG